MWFEKLMGFKEISYEFVQENIKIKGNFLISKVNGKSYQFGKLEIPTLKNLQNQINIKDFEGKIQVNEMVGNVREFHCLQGNSNALFQAASQFNLLEMVSPEIIPEKGVGIYENDYTQGPSCAISCGAGTIFRNYFVTINERIGQTRNNQVDCLNEIGKFLKNEELNLWKMRNGYAFPTEEGLNYINSKISKMDFDERENLKSLLKVGIQWNTEVTISDNNQIVSQIYCSALPIGYSYIPEIFWKNFAKLILEATYEATFYAGLINYRKTGCNKIFLTLVGGGVFGNKMEWILEAISKSIQKFKNTPLDVKIVSYGQSNYMVRELIANFKNK